MNFEIKAPMICAIYGISPATEVFLSQQNNSDTIVGLLDGYCQEGELYGKPIISLEEAIKKGINAIVVVARPSSRRIVVNRIQKVCREKGIHLYDTEGNDLLEAVQKEMPEAVISTIPKHQLMEEMRNAEVISFDVFDTLITRQVLYPADVFSLVEQRLITKYGQGFDFQKVRRQTEASISRGASPDIFQIYKELEKYIALPEKELEEIRLWEWELEQQVILPREEMCELFHYAVSLHKKVYLVSDMYYSSEQLAELLKPFGITGYEKIFVSCDYNTRKNQSLFEHLKAETPANKYLHIGDNPVADVESALHSGIKGIQIRKGLDMFEAMPWAAELLMQDKVTDRLKLGMLIAKLFNSPFVLEKGSLTINSPEILGCLVAPLLADFMFWLKEQTECRKDNAILFCARDGFLIKKLFDVMIQETASVKSVYFLTSRISAVSAGMFDKRDIACVSMQGELAAAQDLLRERFFLSEEDIRDITAKSRGYEDVILVKSKTLRTNYLEYIKTLDIPKENNTLFDFVSSGTCQLYLEKILGQKLQGYYFMRVPADASEKRQLSVASFYSDEERDNSKVYEDYFILENLLTSPMSSLKCFDENGIPEYAEETRSKEEIAFIMALQDGILTVFGKYLELLPESLRTESDKKCSEGIWNLIHQVPIENNVFRELTWEDNFYLRSASMKELL